VLPLDQIQGNILRGYRFPVSRYIFARVGSAAAARSWLSGVVGQVTYATDWGNTRPSSTLNVGFTHRGLAALGLADTSLASFPEDFRIGMADRAALLGDVGPSHPDNWEAGLGTANAVSRTHLLVSLYAVNEQVLAARVQVILAAMQAAGLEIVTEQPATRLPNDTEHFGYADGISQPAVADSGDPGHPGDGIATSGGGWRPLAVGEFVLGYPAEGGGATVPLPVDALGRNGTYLVYRKLHQNVPLFRQYIAAAAERLRLDHEWVAARVVGRWRDGTPVERSPDFPDPAFNTSQPDEVNRFTYAADSSGRRCPLGAHIRRANPRDGLGNGPVAVVGHRLIRRGVPYGRPLPLGAADDGQDRGLVFMAVNASIREQFEFVQRLWMQSGGFAGLDPANRDPLIGANDGGPNSQMVIPMAPFPRFLVDLPRFVTLRFGAYLFLPSRRALQHLAEEP
jgi:Dyp-type peroxidase family